QRRGCRRLGAPRVAVSGPDWVRPQYQLLSASRDVIVLLAAFAAIGAAMSFARSRSRQPGGTHVGPLAASRRNVCCLPPSSTAATSSWRSRAPRWRQHISSTEKRGNDDR